jgi:transcriptional regulator with XRE-family HTH domain
LNRFQATEGRTVKVPAETVKAMGQRLQELRDRAGLTQQALAQCAGIPVSSLRNWEQGRVLPQLDAAYRLAKAMNITLDELAGKVFMGAAAKKKPAPKGKTRPRKAKGE